LINNKISYIQKQILELDSQLKQDRCPVCKQIITEETKQVIRDQIKSYEEEISNYNNQITNLKNSIDVLLLEKTNELEKVKLEYSNKYTEIDNQIKLETVNLEDVNKKIKDINNSINMIDTNKLYQEVLDELNVNPDVLNNNEKYISMFKTLSEYKTSITNKQSEISYLDNEVEKLVSSSKNIQLDLENKQSKLEDLTIEKNIYNYWNNVKLFRNILLTKISKSINHLLVDKYKSLVKVEFSINEKDIDIITTNLNGETVSMDSLSQGEQTIALLSIGCALRDILSSKYKVNWLFLDEFLDKLDQDNMTTIVDFIDNNISGHKFVITHNTYALELQNWNDVIDMSVVF
jgi:DNA repair exonuclease SbcCD ATPase subunit